jgi:hypothetical protein
MADAPDFVLLIQIAITLGQNAVPPSSVTEKAVLELDRYYDNAATPQNVVSYTVPVGKSFVLSAIEIACDNYDVAEFGVIIGGYTMFSGKQLQTSLNAQFSNVNLKAGDPVTVVANSDGVTNITVDATIEGKEIG